MTLSPLLAKWAVWLLLTLYVVVGVCLAWGAVGAFSPPTGAESSREAGLHPNATLYLATSVTVFLSGLVLCVLHLRRTARMDRL